MNQMSNQSQKCGCVCDNCSNSKLLEEIERLKTMIDLQKQQIIAIDSHNQSQFEMKTLTDKLLNFQEKYDRILENYRKTQKINQNLEDKLLNIANFFEIEREDLNKKIAAANDKLSEAMRIAKTHQRQTEILKSDFKFIVRSLRDQTNINFELLPEEIKQRLRNFDDFYVIEQSQTTRVPVASFPSIEIDSGSAETSRNIQFEAKMTARLIKDLERSDSLLYCQKCNEKIDSISKRISPITASQSPTITSKLSHRIDDKIMIV
ncbi:glycoprotein [Sarcoptes scabiei]|nr:glycoprotein [Sarcoptes scabiei]